MVNKKYTVKYLSSFNEELSDILYYISFILKNPIAAENFLEKIIKSIEFRSINPKSHEIYTNRKLTWYRIYVANYIIYYVIENNIMIIAHIIYGARDIKNLI